MNSPEKKPRIKPKYLKRSASCSNITGPIESVPFELRSKKLNFSDFDKRYVIDQTLEGSSELTSVFMGFTTTTTIRRKTVIIKLLKFHTTINTIPPERLARMADRELYALSILEHPAIISMLHYTINAEHLFVYIAFPYYPMGNLLAFLHSHEYRDKVPHECVAKEIFFQLVNAIAYCHKSGICHGDVKLENLLVSSVSTSKCTGQNVPKIVLIDFGLSQPIEYDVNGNEYYLSEILGSPDYVAPEIIQKRPYHGTKIDVWSMGIFLYVLLFSDFPFHVDSNSSRAWRKILQDMKKNTLFFPSYNPISDECKNLFHRMLRFNPQERITVSQLYQDPWFDCVRVQ